MYTSNSNSELQTRSSLEKWRHHKAPDYPDFCARVIPAYKGPESPMCPINLRIMSHCRWKLRWRLIPVMRRSIRLCRRLVLCRNSCKDARMRMHAHMPVSRAKADIQCSVTSPFEKLHPRSAKGKYEASEGTADFGQIQIGALVIN